MNRTPIKKKGQPDAVRRMVAWAALALAAWLLSHTVAQLMLIQGSSMEPTYRPGQLTVVYRLEREFPAGKVIAFRAPGIPGVLVKRIVALPGETVTIREGILYRSGRPQPTRLEPMADPGLAANPIVLGPGEYFVLGDNRNHSTDSRFAVVGIVERSQIVGSVWPQ